ncbi:hypothetical protein [Brevundimonas sp.]|jgi:hypothetical protein|uniref:hypothetical protein n=1 Tax=Brevundimonas sp. TaxID=1871086 RepID=UPI002ED81EA6
MMSGYVEHPFVPARAPRRYRVVRKAAGWSVALGDACTLPMAERSAALRIARRLQAQADRLNGRR